MVWPWSTWPPPNAGGTGGSISVQLLLLADSSGECPEAARLPSEFAAGFWGPGVWRPAWLPRLRAEACLAACLGPGGGRLFADLIITNFIKLYYI